MTKLRDRDGEVWTPDDDGTYGALDGTFSGWRRKDIEAQYGPVIEILEPDADPFRGADMTRWTRLRSFDFEAAFTAAILIAGLLWVAWQALT